MCPPKQDEIPGGGDTGRTSSTLPMADEELGGETRAGCERTLKIGVGNGLFRIGVVEKYVMRFQMWRTAWEHCMSLALYGTKTHSR